MVGRKIIDPFPIQKIEHDDGSIEMIAKDLEKHKDKCGANNYYYDTNTIEFIVNGDSRCLVRLRQVNNVVMNTHINLDYDSFLKNDKFGMFRDKVAAFLGIDSIKIVGHSKK